MNNNEFHNKEIIVHLRNPNRIEEQDIKKLQINKDIL